jgi:hypothetical protein
MRYLHHTARYSQWCGSKILRKPFAISGPLLCSLSWPQTHTDHTLTVLDMRTAALVPCGRGSGPAALRGAVVQHRASSLSFRCQRGGRRAAVRVAAEFKEQDAAAPSKV